MKEFEERASSIREFYLDLARHFSKHGKYKEEWKKILERYER